VRFEYLNDGKRNAVFSDVKPFNLIVVFYPLVCGISVNHSYPLDLCVRFLRNVVKDLQNFTTVLFTGSVGASRPHLDVEQCF
jgi:hypothetical protein